jgi:hypothetical protein
MNDLVNFVVYALLCYAVLRLVTSALHKGLKAELEAREELVKKIQGLVHLVKEEKHGEMTYWFDEDSDQFLAQGRTSDEIVKVLKERFNNHIFILMDQEKMMAGPDFELVPISASVASTGIKL